MPVFHSREKNIAYEILRGVMEAPPEQDTFIGYIGREHIIGVTRQICRFLNDGQGFMEYKRPP